MLPPDVGTTYFDRTAYTITIMFTTHLRLQDRGEGHGRSGSGRWEVVTAILYIGLL